MPMIFKLFGGRPGFLVGTREIVVPLKMSMMYSRCYSFFHFHSSSYLQQYRPRLCSLRRHHRRRLRRHLIPQPASSDLLPPLSSHLNLKLVIDIPSLYDSSESKLQRFLRSGTEALDDLRTLITFDDDRRLVVSCHRPTLLFFGNLTLLVFIFVFASGALFKLGLGLRLRIGRNSDGLVYRRDRSLGGKEVLVGKNLNVPTPTTYKGFRNPMDSGSKKYVAGQRKEERRLPSWWPVSLPPPVVTGDKQEYQRMADRLIRAILDQRIIGNDISDHDIVQFRGLCRSCGVTVSVETANARDSFYRASVDFVLNICESVDYHSTSVDVDGEDAQQFVAGIAANIGVENSHAARIVTAAIAARTRSRFLQAWALEMQGKHSEAAVELSKICLLHRIFPPEGNSPEMEMVARSLEKHLKLEQRKFLMGMFAGICNDGNHRSVAEALGLIALPEFGTSREAS